jgi:hypothetical protein
MIRRLGPFAVGSTRIGLSSCGKASPVHNSTAQGTPRISTKDHQHDPCNHNDECYNDNDSDPTARMDEHDVLSANRCPPHPIEITTTLPPCTGELQRASTIHAASSMREVLLR